MSKRSAHTTRFTAVDKVAALRRELGKRRKVYPQRIGRGMSAQKAEHEIAVIEAILRDYLRCAFCRKTMADWHEPEMIAGNPEARRTVQLVACEGLYVCTKCSGSAPTTNRHL